VAGQAVADLVLGGAAAPLWSPYGPDRFQAELSIL
jgi:glycine/D-amino acid oxidase-like deaminating enzyme